jgi:hypothetical protein
MRAQEAVGYRPNEFFLVLGDTPFSSDRIRARVVKSKTLKIEHESENGYRI